MKKDNEAKMKEILNELEDEFLEEEIVEDKAEETESEEVVEETAEEEVVEEETEETVEEEVAEEEAEETVEEEAAEEETEETVEEEAAEEETEENVEEEVAEEETEEKVEEEPEKKEKIEEKKKVDKKEKKSKKELDVKESPIRKIGNYLIDKLKKYKYVLILDLVVFLFLFFLIPTIILDVKPIIWMSLFLIFTILPTIAFYLRNLYKKYQITLGIPFFYLCILCVLDSCTIKDLYGITSHGALDKTPAWVDAILVTFIIVFFQYVGLTVIDFSKKCFKRTK